MAIGSNIIKVFIIIFCFFSFSANAQFTEQDCLGAIPICSQEYIPYHSGVEFNDFVPPLSSAGCVNNEVNSVWLYIQVDQTSPPGATLTMIITPENGLAADYDWALFGPSYFCGQLGTPIRCSAAPANCFYCPNTGFIGGQGFPLNAEDKATGDGFLPLIGTFPGEGYYILVNNYNNDPGGFIIQFGGATILDCTPTPPCMMQVFTSADVTVCQGEAGVLDFETTEIGGGGLVDWEWTSTPAIAVNFLSDKNSPNPSVTIPPSFSGQIVYTVTGTIPVCTQSEDITVTVIPAPIVSLQPLPPQICTTADPIPLNFSPPGGYFEGNGPIFGGIFNPSEWGPGDFILTYKVEFGSGCIGDAEIDLNIVNGPEATIDFVDEFCINDPVFTLLATEPGGKWGGVANIKGEIDPKKLGVGSFKVTYLVDDGFCKNSDEINIEVKPLPIVTIIDPGQFCDDQPIQTLTGLPNKGKWTGLPDTLGKFNPSVLGAGNYIAYYGYTDLFGCKNADTLSIKINPKPFATVSSTAQVCNATDNNNTTLLNFASLVNAGDLGGNWLDIDGSGAVGVFPNLDFNNVLPGKYTFSYTTNSAKAPCTETVYFTEVEVVDCKCPALFLASSVTLCNDNPVYDLENLKLNTNNGSWSIISAPNGSNPAFVTGTNFNASNKDSGNYVVEFFLSNKPPAGCPESSTSTIIVNPKPSASFSTTKTVCNKFLNGNTPVVLDFKTYITAGDTGGTWKEITNSGATGTFPVLDFTGVTPGNYKYEYTTNSALAPCVESVYQIDLIVQDCECPSLALINDSELCNSGLDFNLDLLKITTESGNWSIKSTPSGVNPIVLTGNSINIFGKDAGQYVFNFMLSQAPPGGCPTSADITITLYDQPNATVTGNVTICNSNLNGNNSIINFQNLISNGTMSGIWLDVNNSGATGPDIAKDFNGVIPGNYTFTFTTNTAIFPCIDQIFTVIVKVNDCNCPLITLTPFTTLCNQGNASIDLNNLKLIADAGSWKITSSPPGPNPANLSGSTFNALNTNAGIYVVSFTLQNNPPPGCPKSADLTIEVVAPPISVLNTTVNICNATGSGQYSTTINLFDQILSGDKSGTFADTDNSGASVNVNIWDFTGVLPGSYTFTYTTNSAVSPCKESIYTIEVIVENCDCPSVSTKNPGNLCSDNANFDLDLLKITNEPGTWSITSQPSGPNQAFISGNTFNGTNSNSGVYVLTFKLQNPPPSGCPDFSQQTFTISQALSSGTIQNPLSLCQNQGQLVNLSNLLVGASVGGTWKEVSVITSQNNIQNIQNGLFNTQNQNPGTYLIEYQVTPQSPCQSKSTVVQITINENPIADAGSDKQITCSEPLVTIGGLNSSNGPEISYSWSNGNSNNSTATTNIAGSYTITVTNSLTGCSATDVVNVVQSNDLPSPENLVLDSIDCFGNSNGKIRFDGISGGSAPYTVFLNGVDFGKAQYFTKLPPGKYSLKIIDANGCSSENNFILTEPDEVYLELGDDITITLGDSTKLEPFINIPFNEIDTIIWSPVIGNACAGCFEPVLSPYYTTPLQMLVTDKNGCRITDQILITVDVIRPIYFPNIFSADGDALNDRFYPFAGDLVTNIVEFKIFDRWGDLVFSQNNFKPNNYDKGWDGTRNGQKLNSGVYVYYAVVEFKDGAKKVFKGDVTLKH